ncbi:hypothetical protein BJV78DRAFT_212142 [Lactifluus subvellereus]|nr:hypothetical protein BJV78DRAFT_212142 [Lactifluus subvellereus]
MLSQAMVEHRARALSALLPIALATGYSETEPDLEPLKNLDTDLIVEYDDTTTRFPISDRKVLPADIIRHLYTLRESWNLGTPRQSIPDFDWVSEFGLHISALTDLRVRHVQLWLDSNLERFEVGHAAVEDLRRKFDKMVIEMRRNVQLCKASCASCHLLCVRNHLHMGKHSCKTRHKCVHSCTLCGDSVEPAGHTGEHVCVVKPHLCGKPCKLSGKLGCSESCTRERRHVHDEHTCSAPLHMCGEPCDLQKLKLPGGETYSCQERCTIRSGLDHQVHFCDARQCPVKCALCNEPCKESHLHGLTWDVHHLPVCGGRHPCQALCAAPGICEIDTTPLTSQLDSTRRHLTFQHTKYIQVAKRLQCAKIIEPGKMEHTGPHIHTRKRQPFHYCETRCSGCGHFCTLQLGHTQQEHETSHGSMTQTCWGVEGPDEEDIELGGRTFSFNDDGTSMMCNLVCSSMGRHVHIDYCLSNGEPCKSDEVRHINARITPDPDRPKDAVTHSLYWRRMDLRTDPYTRDEQISFRKCDAMCSGSEHSASEPSYCTLPMFHPPRSPDEPVNGSGYVSSDGHFFECTSPAVKKQAFHVIFIIDSSGSMLSTDHQPLADTPVVNQIRQRANNRLGAVYSALHSFWSARHVVNARDETFSTRFKRVRFRPISFILSSVDDVVETVVGTVVGLGRIIGNWITGSSKAGRRTATTPCDAYSVILFNGSTKEVLVNDTTSSPDELLKTLLRQPPAGGSRNIPAALHAAEAVMVQNWSPERTPIMVFLSTGQGPVSDEAIRDVCCSAIEHGKPLSLHAVSFGGETSSTSPLPKMANLALKIQKDAARSHTVPGATNIPSSFTTALDTVHLTSIFLGIEESLRKPRPSSSIYR